jgi:hypothetical protein
VIPPRANPFAAARFAPGELPWIGELESLVERVCVPNARLQILGPHGSGKSTLLHHLESRAARRGWSGHRFRGSRGFDPLVFFTRPGPLVVFADEIAELGAHGVALLRAVCRVRGASLVVTAHCDVGFETLCERAVDAATLKQLCHRLLGGAESPPPSVLEALLVAHRGNVREVFFDLYDAAAVG